MSATASAAEFSLGGYYRMRLELFKDLSVGYGLNGFPNNASTGYWQQRVRLDPKIKLNDNVAFFAQIDMLDNVLAGDDPEIETQYGFTLPEFLSQGVVPQHDASTGGSSLRNIAVKRAWGEVLTGVGQFKFGRMGSHWGLGILANDGNGWDDDYGDTVDRIMFITKAGPIYLVPMVDKIAEGAFLEFGNNQRPADTQTNPGTLSTGSDDVDEFIMVAVYRGELTSGGVYGFYRIQPKLDSQVTGVDAWGKTRIGPLAVEAEGVYLDGRMFNFVPPSSPPRITAKQWGFALESSVPLGHVQPGFDLGAASGDDKSGPANGSLDNFTFDRDYHIAFLLFRYVTVDQGPHAVTNAMYVKPKLHYDLFDNFGIDLAVLHAQTLTSAPTYGKGPYGEEVDVGATWKLYDNFETGLRYGALFPGKALKPTAPGTTGKLDSVVQGLEGRFLIRF